MLTGDKIILRPVRIEDWQETVKWRNDLFIKSSTMSHPFPVTGELEKEWYEKVTRLKDNSFLPFTVVSREDSRILGYFSLNNINWISRNGLVSGAIGETENMGKGIGREAVDILLKYAFDYLNLIKISAWVKTEHPALNTWFELGAVKEGVLARHFYSEGKYSDVAFISWFRAGN
jgi:RimJ/RimL family protein N-acetyltransferase